MCGLAMPDCKQTHPPHAPAWCLHPWPHASAAAGCRSVGVGGARRAGDATCEDGFSGSRASSRQRRGRRVGVHLQEQTSGYKAARNAIKHTWNTT